MHAPTDPPAPSAPSGHADESEALETLAREIAPPDALERSTLAALRRSGLVGSDVAPAGRPPRGQGGGRPLALAAAVALVAFALGLWLSPRLERARASVADGEGDRYLLLLYEPRPIDRSGLDLVAEYGAWARQLARSGQLVAAEKLKVEEQRFDATSSSDTAGAERSERTAGPTGFFLIRAASADEAEAIARSCPHLKHGGEVALRPVDPT